MEGGIPAEIQRSCGNFGYGQFGFFYSLYRRFPECEARIQIRAELFKAGLRQLRVSARFELRF